MKKIIGILAVGLLALGITACDPEEESQGKKSSSASAAPEDDSRCLDVSKRVANGIAGGKGTGRDEPLDGRDFIHGPDLVVLDSAAVKSEDFDSDVYMVALEFRDGDDTQQGVWAVLDPKRSGPIMAVDEVAKLFTIWPNGTVDAPLDITVDGAEEALECLSQ